VVRRCNTPEERGQLFPVQRVVRDGVVAAPEDEHEALVLGPGRLESGATLLGRDEGVVCTVQNERWRPTAGQLAEWAENLKVLLHDVIDSDASPARNPSKVAEAALEHDAGDEPGAAWAISTAQALARERPITTIGRISPACAR
jgi:hypothetical protein